MIKFLVRCAMFIAGVVLILDIVLPARTEQLRVDGHTSYTQSNYRPTSGRNNHWTDTSYTLRLTGGIVSSCSVGYANYEKLRDGDAVEVKSTKLFSHCISITRGEEHLELQKFQKPIAIVFGLLLIAAAVGWLKSNGNNGNGITISID